MEREPVSGERRLGFRPGTMLALAWLSAAVAGASVGPAPPQPTAHGQDAAPFPFGERLHYSVRWMGIRCGTMTLESFAEPRGADTVYVIVMNASSSRFFDGIYRVRTRIESRFSGRQTSSIRYHSVSDENHRVREDLFEFDLEVGEIRRTKDGEPERFELPTKTVHDPLAYMYRLRALAGAPGGSTSLVLATSRGPLDTAARVVEQGRVRTPLGRFDALKVVPEPEDGMLFRRSGQMAIWVGLDELRTPYRIEFDLSFGRLVAVLESRERLTARDGTP